MSIIANWTAIDNLGGSITENITDYTQCPTKYDITYYSDVTVSGTYADNQLVQLSDISI